MTLTREEILAMEIGNELDIEIAVTVMGRERDKFRSGWIRLGDLSTYPKQYSKDISAAWDVLQKHKTHQVTYSETGFSHSELKYRVIVGKNQNVAYADTAPEAICKASLLAVLNL
ncbi:hypothetical protein NST50_14045 [Paenibacillus sp. FSL E2-0202]|uniref:BC1872 family protein n=1 Tax=Paenibacillus sp. FSL E2-0202 TaxID=2954505 RepID=UPI0030EB3126